MASGFLDAQKSGVGLAALPAASQAAYGFLQAPSFTTDPVTGGFFATGTDFVKYALPQSWAVALLAWALIAFPQGLEKAGQTAAVRAHVRHGADYLMACHSTADSFVAQIGNPADYLIDIPARNGSWGWPSDAPRNRTAFVITADSPGGADVAANAAAALAAAAVAMGPVDAGWAAGARAKAASLYRLATALNPKPGANGSYCAAIPCFEGLKTGGYRWRAFVSDSVFDDLAWAGAWLNKATGQRAYLSDAQYFMQQHLATELDPTKPGSYAPNYNTGPGWGAQLLLAQALDDDAYRLRVAQFLRGWMSGKNDYGNVLLVTKRGLAYLPADNTGGDPEPLPHAAGAALMALLYAKGDGSPTNRPLSDATRARLECFALGQITYMLGGNVGKNNGYLVGFGPRYPRAPAHRQASCPPSTRRAAPRKFPNPSIISGALVAGPGPDDSFVDSRAAPGARVGVHYTAPFVGALAGLVQAGAGPGRCQGGRGFIQELLPTDQFLGA